MKFLFAISFNLFIISSVHSTSWAETKSVYKSLNSAEIFSFKDIVKDRSVSILFQPHCNSCKKQIQDLECLKEEAKDIFLVGSLATEDQVKTSYLKKSTDLKGYFVQRENLNQLGFEDSLAPQTIVYSSSKPKRFIGLTSCSKIAAYLKGLPYE